MHYRAQRRKETQFMCGLMTSLMSYLKGIFFFPRRKKKGLPYQIRAYEYYDLWACGLYALALKKKKKKL